MGLDIWNKKSLNLIYFCWCSIIYKITVINTDFCLENGSSSQLLPPLRNLSGAATGPIPYIIRARFSRTGVEREREKSVFFFYSVASLTTSVHNRVGESV